MLARKARNKRNKHGSDDGACRDALKSVSCQVSGCRKEVPERAYYRRYKICPHHTSLPSMVLNGAVMRWCQQCGKFQEIEEFEGDRRSCRRTLDQHNARRRRQGSAAGRSGSTGSDPPAKPLFFAARSDITMEQAGGGALAQFPTKCASPSGSRKSPKFEAMGSAEEAEGRGGGSASGASGGGGGGGSDSCQPVVLRGCEAAGQVPPPPRLCHLRSLEAGDLFPLPAPLSKGMAVEGEAPLMEPRESWGTSGWGGGTPSAGGGQEGGQLQGSFPSPWASVPRGPLERKGSSTELHMDYVGESSLLALEQLRDDAELRAALGLQADEEVSLPDPADLVPLDMTGMLLCSGNRAAAPTPDSGPFNCSSLTVAAAATAPSLPAPPPFSALQLPQPPSVPVGMDLDASPPPAKQLLGSFTEGGVLLPLHAWRGAGGVPASASPGLPLHSPTLDHLPPELCSGVLPCPASDPLTQQATAVQQVAAGGCTAPKRVPQHSSAMQSYMARLSVKLFNVEPQELPQGLQRELVGLAAAEPVFVESFVRPGCTHVTVSALVPPCGECSQQLPPQLQHGPGSLGQHSKQEGGGGGSPSQALPPPGPAPPAAPPVVDGQGGVLPGASPPPVPAAALTAEGVALALLRRGGWVPDGAGGGDSAVADMLVQLEGEVVLVRGGRVVARLRAAAVAPSLRAVRPAALLASDPQAAALLGGAGGAGRVEGGSTPSSPTPPRSPSSATSGDGRTEAGDAGGVVTLWGYGISQPGTMVVCRQNGRVLDLEVLGSGAVPPPLPHPSAPAPSPASLPPPEWVMVRPLGLAPGLVEVEVQRGALLSEPMHALALPSAAAVEEAQQAQRALSGSLKETFLRDVGWVISSRVKSASGAAGSPAEQQAAAALPRPEPEPGGGTAAARLARRLAAVAQAHGWQMLSLLLAPAERDGAGEEGRSGCAAHPTPNPVPAPAPEGEGGKEGVLLAGQHSAGRTTGAQAEGGQSQRGEVAHAAATGAEPAAGIKKRCCRESADPAGDPRRVWLPASCCACCAASAAKLETSPSAFLHGNSLHPLPPCSSPLSGTPECQDEQEKVQGGCPHLGETDALGTCGPPPPPRPNPSSDDLQPLSFMSGLLGLGLTLATMLVAAGSALALSTSAGNLP